MPLVHRIDALSSYQITCEYWSGSLATNKMSVILDYLPCDCAPMRESEQRTMENDPSSGQWSINILTGNLSLRETYWTGLASSEQPV